MRSIINRKLLTAAAATGILSLTGGFALAANSAASTGGTPGPGTGHHHEVPLPASLCGKGMQLGGVAGAAVGDLCAHIDDDPGGYGDGPGHGHPKPPSTPPPSTPPTSAPPTYTPPTSTPPTSTPPTSTPPTSAPPKPELPDTGADTATLMGAAAVSAALLIGGTVMYLRGGRLVRAGRQERRH